MDFTGLFRIWGRHTSWEIPRAIAPNVSNCLMRGKSDSLLHIHFNRGVNTKAKSVIVYDNKIARAKFDYLHLTIYVVALVEMGSYFIGHIYLFHEHQHPNFL